MILLFLKKFPKKQGKNLPMASLYRIKGTFASDSSGLKCAWLGGQREPQIAKGVKPSISKLYATSIKYHATPLGNLKLKLKIEAKFKFQTHYI